MAIGEIDSDEERRSRLRRKKETLEMDDNLEIQGTHGTEGSDARGSRDPVPPPLETSIAQRSAPDLFFLRARAADDPHHRQPHKEPGFPIIMADYCFMQDSPGGELFTILDMLDVALGMMVAISVEEKGHLRTWSRRWSNICERCRTSNSSTGRCDSVRQKRRNRHRMSTKVFLTTDGPG